MLEVDAVHTFYGESHVLQGASLEVRPGEVVALLGRNGAGKTTLVRSVVGFVGPGAADHERAEASTSSHGSHNASPFRV